MPEKRNENKIMAMLERSGVIRKAGADGSLDTDAGSRGDSDIRPLFDVPDDQIKVTPAARQPVPGMPNPVFPSDRSAEAAGEYSQAEEIAELERIVAEEDPAPEAYAYEEPYSPPSHEPVYAEPAVPPAEPQRQASSFSGLNPYGNGSSYEDTTAAQPVAMERAPQNENYTDRFLNTDELYDALALRSKKTDSIYLIEEYLQTLPGSLPDSSRREIVSKLIAASGFDYDLLMGDGVLRVKMLKEYAERFARHTDDYIAARQAELDELDQQILRTRRLIENRKELHKKQFFSIEAEAQRLKDILTFISG